jgi:hypothetical protein
MKLPHYLIIAVVLAALAWWFFIRKGAKRPKLSIAA